MTPVKSSNIASIAHDPKSNEMRVTFKNGTTYSYSGVLGDHYSKMLDADSAGKYFATHIRGGGYKSTKVEE